MKSLKGKVIWITGASSGIGEALVYELQNQDVKMILSARRKEELERVKGNCFPEKQKDISILALDLADHQSLQAKTTEAIATFGPIDIFISNGGISQRDTAIKTSLEVDRQIMEVNYFGSITLSKYLLPEMVKRGSGHHVIVSSAVGIISSPLRSGYAASKHALHGFYDALRAEHHKDNIKVTIICPGYIKTNISFNALMGDGARQNKMDRAQANGISSEVCARKIIRAIRKENEEVYIGGVKEVLGIYVKRFFPRLFSKIITRMRVT